MINPKQVYISLLILFFFSLSSYSQKIAASHIQDAETGEASGQTLNSFDK
jgi:hypothetical protein